MSNEEGNARIRVRVEKWKAQCEEWGKIRDSMMMTGKTPTAFQVSLKQRELALSRGETLIDRLTDDELKWMAEQPQFLVTEVNPVAAGDGPRVDAEKEFSGIGRNLLIAMIITLRARLAEYEEGGIIIRGWWCNGMRGSTGNAIGVRCDTFNGEEKEKYTHCRNCGNIKPEQKYMPNHP